MKKILFTVMSLVLLVCLTHGAVPSILPTTDETHYRGAHDFSFDLGTEGVLNGRLEFAVYTENQFDLIGYEGDSDYVYAYQVFNGFNGTSSTAALDYFALTAVDSSTIASVKEDISQGSSLNLSPSGGKEPSISYFNDSFTKAIWEFDGDDGAIVQGERSWFLFLYSDKDWIAGDIEVQPSAADDEIPIPEVPEPATLALLGLGAVLSLRSRK